jgi:hypothetical protein
MKTWVLGCTHPQWDFFSLPPPVCYIDSDKVYAISIVATDPPSSIPFKASYFEEDPWVVLEPSAFVEESGYVGSIMPLFVTKFAIVTQKLIT